MQFMQSQSIRTTVLGVLSALGAMLTHALGGWDITLQVLIGFLAADYLTGLVLAGVFKRSPKTSGGALSSAAGFQGIVRKCAVLLLVLLAALLDRVTGSTYIRTTLCFFFIANEGLSILENLGMMGVPYPRFLREMLEAIRQKSSDGKE